MTIKKMLIGLFILYPVIMMACAQTGSPIRSSADQAVVEVAKGTTAEAWEIEWGKTMQAARKEGRVVVYATSLGPALNEVIPLFKNRYGIILEIISGRGGELMTKLISERRAGVYYGDVLITGTNTYFGQTEPEGIADPLEPTLILPEVLEPKNWYGGNLNWGDMGRKSLQIFAFPMPNVAINTNLVKPGEVKGLRDLLNPRWKGKIVMNDPTISGSGLKGFSVLGFQILDLDYFRHLAKQEPLITRDQRMQIEWLAQGKYPVLVFPILPQLTPFKEAGAPVDSVLAEEGTYITRSGGAVSLLNRASHPNAAKVMINWIFSREGLTHISKQTGSQSSRIDVPTDFLDPNLVRQPGTRYFTEADSKEWTAKDDDFKKAANDIFRQLLR